MLRDPEAIEEMLEEICAEREQWQDRKAAQAVTVQMDGRKKQHGIGIMISAVSADVSLRDEKNTGCLVEKAGVLPFIRMRTVPVTIPDLVRFSLDGEGWTGASGTDPGDLVTPIGNM